MTISRTKPAVLVLAMLGAVLSACGGGSGGSGGDGPETGGFTEPADALLHATLVLVFGLDTDDVPSPGSSCSDAGSQSVETVTVDSPYAAGGSMSAIQVTYDECTDGDERVDGRMIIGSDGDASHVRLGTASGEGFIVEDARDVSTYQGASDFCGLGCASIDGVPAREMRSDLSVDFHEHGGGQSYALVRGTDSQPLLQRWREDYPAAGQTTFWLQGFLSVETNGECQAAAQYSVPDETQAPVLAAGGGGAGGLFDSGLLRMERNGTVAEATYGSAGLTIAVDGVSNTYTWEQVFDAWVNRCDINL